MLHIYEITVWLYAFLEAERVPCPLRVPPAPGWRGGAATGTPWTEGGGIGVASRLLDRVPPERSIV